MAIFDTIFREFLEPIDSNQNKLFKIVMEKQLHICNFWCQQQNNRNNCKYGFFFKPHIEEITTYNPWRRKNGSILDQGTKTTMLSLTIHPCYWCGVRCTFEFAMYKYNILIVLSFEIRNEMRAPWFHKLEQKNDKWLGLHEAFDAQFYFISSLIITRLVSPLEVVFACLQIPIVQKNIDVKYIDFKPPAIQTIMVIRSRALGFHHWYLL